MNRPLANKPLVASTAVAPTSQFLVSLLQHAAEQVDDDSSIKKLIVLLRKESEIGGGLQSGTWLFYLKAYITERVKGKKDEVNSEILFELLEEHIKETKTLVDGDRNIAGTRMIWVFRLISQLNGTNLINGLNDIFRDKIRRDLRDLCIAIPLSPLILIVGLLMAVEVTNLQDPVRLRLTSEQRFFDNLQERLHLGLFNNLREKFSTHREGTSQQVSKTAIIPPSNVTDNPLFDLSVPSNDQEEAGMQQEFTPAALPNKRGEVLGASGIG